MEPRKERMYVPGYYGTKDRKNVYKDTLEPRMERMYIRILWNQGYKEWILGYYGTKERKNVYKDETKDWTLWTI